MKNVSWLIAILVLPVLMSFTSGNDRCTEWMPWRTSGREANIYLKICERESGGSGYYSFKNDNKKAVYIGYKLTYNNGKTFKGGRRIQAYSETGGISCSECASKNGGVKEWELTSVIFEGEVGF